MGIMAHNEGANIGNLLRRLTDQEFTRGKLTEIFVVASGCTDRTEGIVLEFAALDPRIRLLTQPRREGKASAINLFIAAATGDVLILESGDTFPEQNTLDRLVAPFNDPTVGMTGARPVPVDLQQTFMGYAVHLLWQLHHRIALTAPKLGELVAFRNFVTAIPVDTATDEASLEAIVAGAGYQLRYIPDAIVRNKGPETIRDFILQRRRIACGHLHLRKREHYRVSTSSPFAILKILLRGHSANPRDILWTLTTVGIEALSRLLGFYDYCIMKKNPVIWDIAASTKRLE